MHGTAAAAKCGAPFHVEPTDYQAGGSSSSSGACGNSGSQPNRGSGGEPKEGQDEAPARGRGLWKYQTVVRDFYSATKTQVIIAVLLVLYFIVQCVQSQWDPHDVLYSRTWQGIEDVFNILFALELAVNAYGRWLRPFWSSGWNVFDVVVVFTGMVNLCRLSFPEPFAFLNAPLRMLRVFRVFRLFEYVESLHLILLSIKRAMPGVLNAFNIILLTICIYSVLAVYFFKDIHRDCWSTPNLADAITWRGMCFGDEYYGTFLRALYTLFQVLTGESWSEAVVRPILHFHKSSVLQTIFVTIFFISFVLIMAGVFVNVLVALLLDGMGNPDGAEPTQDQCGDHGLDVSEDHVEEALEKAYEELAELKVKVRATSLDLRSRLASVLAEAACRQEQRKAAAPAHINL